MVGGQGVFLQLHLFLDALDDRTTRLHRLGQSLANGHGSNGLQILGPVEGGEHADHGRPNARGIVAVLSTLVVPGQQIVVLRPVTLCDQEDTVRIGGLKALVNAPNKVGWVNQVS